VCVDAKTESGEDDALVIVDEPDAATTSAETATAHAATDDEYAWWYSAPINDLIYVDA